MSCSGSASSSQYSRYGVPAPGHPDGVARVPARPRDDVDDDLGRRARPPRGPLAHDREVARCILPEGDRQVVAPAALDGPVAAGAQVGELAAERVEVAGVEDGRGDAATRSPALAAQQRVERQAGERAREIPQRHVDGADAERDDAAVAGPVGGVAQLGPGASTSRGSRPMTMGASRRSTMNFVASEASSVPVIASPQPTRPSSVSTRTSVSDRILPSLLGSG